MAGKRPGPGSTAYHSTGSDVKFTIRKRPKFSSPALSEAAAALQKAIDQRATQLRMVESDIIALELMLSKNGAPIFTSKELGIGWEKWQKGKMRLVFADDEEMGPLADGSAQRKFEAYAKLPAFVEALAGHVANLLGEESSISIVIENVTVEKLTGAVNERKVEES